MRIKKLFVFLLVFMFFLTGCGKDSKEDVFKKLTKKVSDVSSYHLTGVLEIINNENSYLYDVDVAYLKENNFKVSLKNQTNNHEQVILRNSDGVYVLTPSLNKSFKFQSEWPYNNSQSYLLQSLLNDINNDSEYTFEEVDDSYIITTKANYSNNKELVKQKIYINKDSNIYRVEVLDSSDLVKLKMDIKDIDYNANYDENYFKLESNMSVSKEVEDELVSKIDDIIYPMYIPQNTYLSTQDKVSVDYGERVILTFAGDYPFMLIQETVSGSDSVVSVTGEPFQISGTIGILDDSSITWINDGVEYYLVSNTLDKSELINVANSLTVAAIEK